MLKTVHVGNRIVLEYTLYAFKTKKGIFTLSGTSSDGTDEWKHLETRSFHTWERRQVYEWFVDGKINAVSESTTLNWYNNTFGKRKAFKTR